MNYVEPIRSIEVIERMKNELLKQGTRNYLLFSLGINVGLRVSDLLTLTVEDVTGAYISVIESKTGKRRKHFINEPLRKVLEDYTEGMSAEDYLFPSRSGGKPISRVQAYRILNGVALNMGIPSIGTHTLRKTFGYHHYQRYKDVAILQEIFNHASPSITLRYIGINQDIIDNSLKDFFL